MQGVYEVPLQRWRQQPELSGMGSLSAPGGGLFGTTAQQSISFHGGSRDRQAHKMIQIMRSPIFKAQVDVDIIIIKFIPLLRKIYTVARSYLCPISAPPNLTICWVSLIKIMSNVNGEASPRYSMLYKSSNQSGKHSRSLLFNATQNYQPCC